jgi:putative ABC transport system permease protein
MFDRDAWQEIAETLGRNRVRTFLTAFGVSWGIFLLVVLLGSGQGMANGAKSRFGDMATNSFFLWSQRTSKPYKGHLQGRPIQMNLSDAEAIRRLPGVRVVAPRIQLGGFRSGANVTRNGESRAFSVMGDFPEVFLVSPVKVTGGRLINALDIADKRKVTVIGKRVVEVFFDKGEEPLGKFVRIGGIDFQVVGTFESLQPGGRGNEEAESLYVPFTTYQQAFNGAGQVGWFSVTADDSHSASVLLQTTLATLRERHSVAPDDLRAFGSFDLAQQFGKMNGLLIGINILMWVVGIGTLTAGAIGVSNIMTIVVKERTAEIGLRRAVGARPRHIISQVSLEAILLTVLAGGGGLMVGVALLEGISYLLESGGSPPQMFRNPGLTFAQAVSSLGILVLAGLLAGIIPARRAVAVPPVEALRSE